MQEEVGACLSPPPSPSLCGIVVHYCSVSADSISHSRMSDQNPDPSPERDGGGVRCQTASRGRAAKLLVTGSVDSPQDPGHDSWKEMLMLFLSVFILERRWTPAKPEETSVVLILE